MTVEQKQNTPQTLASLVYGYKLDTSSLSIKNEVDSSHVTNAIIDGNLSPSQQQQHHHPHHLHDITNPTQISFYSAACHETVEILERHRHRYEVNPDKVKALV
jgi:CTP synthase (UTP-ammonia lyase)